MRATLLLSIACVNILSVPCGGLGGSSVRSKSSCSGGRNFFHFKPIAWVPVPRTVRPACVPRRLSHDDDVESAKCMHNLDHTTVQTMASRCFADTISPATAGPAVFIEPTIRCDRSQQHYNDLRGSTPGL